MAYGIKLTNRFGDRLLESTGLLFPLSTGTTVYVDDRFAYSNTIDHLDITSRMGGVLSTSGSRVDASWNVYPQPTYTVSNLTDGGSFNSYSFSRGKIMQVATNSYSTSYQPRSSAYSTPVNYNRIRHAVPNTSNTSYSYDAFFKLPSVGGLHTFSQVYNPYNFLFDSNCKGLHLYVQKTETNGTGAGVPYIITTTQTPSVGGQNYGMQVFDAGSNKIYDTRYVKAAVGIKDYVRITASQVQSCIQSGTTYNFTLRQAVDTSKVYLGGGSFNSYRNQWVNGTGHYWDLPTLKMTSSTNLQMYRTRYRYSNSSGISLPTKQRFEECLITVLEDS
jgi:hypothetical protein